MHALDPTTLYATPDQTSALAASLGRVLIGRQWLLATAESCTGGGIAAALTEVAGSSAWFAGGIIAYANQVKIDLLAVPSDLLMLHGAVSEPVVLAMASTARIRCGAHIAVAVSGVAGPSGGSAEKPVGTICIAWVTASSAYATTFHFAGDRAQVRAQTVSTALNGACYFTVSN